MVFWLCIAMSSAATRPRTLTILPSDRDQRESCVFWPPACQTAARGRPACLACCSSRRCPSRARVSRALRPCRRRSRTQRARPPRVPGPSATAGRCPRPRRGTSYAYRMAMRHGESPPGAISNRRSSMRSSYFVVRASWGAQLTISINTFPVNAMRVAREATECWRVLEKAKMEDSIVGVVL